MVEQSMEHRFSLLVYVFYALKGVIWAFLYLKETGK